MYLINSRLYPQGPATSRLDYVSYNRALDQPWNQNQIIEKDQEASQTESLVLLFGRNTPNMQIFDCTYYVISLCECFLVTI